MSNKNTNMIIGILAVAVIAMLAFFVLNAPDRRTPGEHVGDAISKLDEGVDDAARELKDSTPLERMKDEYKDATDGSPE